MANNCIYEVTFGWHCDWSAATFVSTLSRCHFLADHDSSSWRGGGGSNKLRAPSQKVEGAQPPLAPTPGSRATEFDLNACFDVRCSVYILFYIFMCSFLYNPFLSCYRGKTFRTIDIDYYERLKNWPYDLFPVAGQIVMAPQPSSPVPRERPILYRLSVRILITVLYSTSN